MGYQTSESQAGNGIMFILSWYYFKNHVQANYRRLYVIFHIRNQRASDKSRAAPRSNIQVLLWTKLSTVCEFEDCEFLREGLLSVHTLYTADHHTDVIFLQKSVKCWTNIILWELDVFVKFWYHTHYLKHIKLVQNRPNLHAETKRNKAGETSAWWCKRQPCEKLYQKYKHQHCFSKDGITCSERKIKRADHETVYCGVSRPVKQKWRFTKEIHKNSVTKLQLNIF